MRPTSTLLGASRLPLTTKRGNKDFYKGTRQAYVPGGGHRTGPPGAFVIRGKAKYRILDDKVRYFVSPGIEKIENSNLRPYVTTTKIESKPLKLPSFSPMAKSKSLSSAFSKAYQSLSVPERNALIMNQRRKWFAALSKEFATAKP